MQVGSLPVGNRRRRLPLLDLLIVIGILASSMAYAAVAVSAHRAISPYDEYVYADYLFGLPEDPIVSIGEETGTEARDLIACRGVIGYGSFGEPCGDDDHAEDSLYPYGGGTGADIYTPLYFTLTWAAAQPVASLFSLSEFDAARLVGGLWLGAGGAVMFLAGRLWGIGTPASAGLSLAAVASPVAFWANTYVSTDAPSLLCGAAVVALVGAVARHGASSWWFAALLPVVVLMKVQHLLLVLLVFAWAVLSAIRATHRGAHGAWWRDRLVIAVTAASGIAVVAQGIWLGVRAASAAGPTIDQGMNQPLTLPALASEATRFLGTTVQAGLSVGLTRDAVGTVLSWLCVAGVLGLIVASAKRDERAFAVAAAIAAVLGAPLLAVATWVTAGIYVPLQPRYGLSLVPAFLVCFGLLVGRPRWSGPVLLLGGMGALAIALALPYEQ